MSKLRTCPRGHQWEAPADEGAPGTSETETCPVCAGQDKTPPPPVKVPPTVPGREGLLSPAAAAPDTPSPGPGDTVGPDPLRRVPGSTGWPAVTGYEVLGELGRGGMGVVYKARQVSLNRLVALKMIRASGLGDPQDLARFRAEAQALARLRHPNVVQVYEVGEQAGRPFFAMEYVDGGSLADVPKGTPQPPRWAAPLVQTLARAMHRAHEQGIIHRDLKPANVLVTADGTPKVSDFGVAKFLMGAGAVRTQSGAVLGTPGYMAPEQAGGNSREVGPATDVYALGAILYELLAGRPPFQAKTPADLVEQVLRAEPVPPSRLGPKVPRDLEAICLKCLHKDARQRYATAAGLADDLGRFLAGEPTQARPVGRGERLTRWAKRRPAAAGLIALGAAMVGGLAAGGWWHASREAALRDMADTRAALYQEQRDTARQERDRARLNEYVAHINLAQREWEQGRAGRALNLLAAHLPREGEEDGRGFEWHYLWSLCHGDLAPPQATLLAGGGRCRNVAFSPDGRRLATAAEAVRVWEAATGHQVSQLQGSGPAECVAFSPDGRSLAAPAARDVLVWDAATGRQVLRIKTPAAGQVLALAFSPDGQRLACASVDGTLRVWEVSEGKGEVTEPFLTLPGPGDRPVCSLAFSPDGRCLASGGMDRTVRVWDVAAGGGTAAGPLRTQDIGLNVDCVAFSPDGRRLASADAGGGVCVWDVSTGPGERATPLLSIRGHAGPAASVAFSPDGRRLASAGGDGTVTIWEASTGQELLSLRGHAEAVLGVAFSPDGGRLVSAGRDGTVQVWPASRAQR
jgi:eukaryotic-like serine/threonine-protein kinase